MLLAACLGLLAVVALALAGGKPRARVPANQRYAQATAQRLLGEVPLPQGAVPASSDESADRALGSGESIPATTQLVQAHAFWAVPGEQPAQAIQWIEQHPPQGARLIAEGSSGQAGRTTSWEATFSYADASGRLATVWLSVAAAAARGGGTALGADALVVWARPRPAAEHVPASARVVTVKVIDRRRHISFASEVGSPARVRAIVAEIEALQRPPQGSSCAGGAMRVDGRKLEPIIDLGFFTASGRRPLVKVRIEENAACAGAVEFWAGSRQEPDLGPAEAARVALHEILGRTL